jgi:vacuolar iron transporter family protein
MTGKHSAYESWHEEQRSASLYRVLANQETDATRKALFERLGGEALEQATMWARDVTDAATWRFEPDTRTRIVAALVRRFGIRAMRPALAAMKVRGMSAYGARGGGALPVEHPMPQSVTEVGARHKSVEGGNLRAAIFGVNDGLVSNASLILGVAGASADARNLVLAGVAGLVAGAFSMAAGEYVSVRSQRELYEYQIGLERDELEKYPEEEAAELALIYEELGLNPDALGSPWGAAISSFASFAAGALIPLLPFLLTRASLALPVSVALSAVTLFGVGAALSLFTGRGALRSGLRMLAIGVAAGAITYAVGKVVGVSLA